MAKPTLMTMSTVGILPDLRSPEKIKSDIEDKERMLADLLCFDRVKVNATDLGRSSGNVEVRFNLWFRNNSKGIGCALFRGNVNMMLLKTIAVT